MRRSTKIADERNAEAQPTHRRAGLRYGVIVDVVARVAAAANIDRCFYGKRVLGGSGFPYHNDTTTTKFVPGLATSIPLD